MESVLMMHPISNTFNYFVFFNSRAYLIRLSISIANVLFVPSP